MEVWGRGRRWDSRADSEESGDSGERVARPRGSDDFEVLCSHWGRAVGSTESLHVPNNCST